MEIHYSLCSNEKRPGLLLSGDMLNNMGFTPETNFKINLYNNGIIMSLFPENTTIFDFLEVMDGDDWSETTGYVEEDGTIFIEQYLLANCGLWEQALTFEPLFRKIVMRIQLAEMLA